MQPDGVYRRTVRGTGHGRGETDSGDKAGSLAPAGAVVHGLAEDGTEGTGVSDILQ